MPRQASTYESSDEPSHSGTGRRGREDDSQSAHRDDSGTADGKHCHQYAKPGKSPEAQTGHGTRPGMRIVLSARDIFSCFGMLHGNADLPMPESGLAKLGDGSIGVEPVLKHADGDRRVSSFHGR
jgi:hypothetical protein